MISFIFHRHSKLGRDFKDTLYNNNDIIWNVYHWVIVLSMALLSNSSRIFGCFFSNNVWCTASETRTQILWRIPHKLHFQVCRRKPSNETSSLNLVQMRSTDNFHSTLDAPMRSNLPVRTSSGSRTNKFYTTRTLHLWFHYIPQGKVQGIM